MEVLFLRLDIELKRQSNRYHRDTLLLALLQTPRGIRLRPVYAIDFDAAVTLLAAFLFPTALFGA
jgi:hypothetical protein